MTVMMMVIYFFILVWIDWMQIYKKSGMETDGAPVASAEDGVGSGAEGVAVGTLPFEGSVEVSPIHRVGQEMAVMVSGHGLHVGDVEIGGML